MRELNTASRTRPCVHISGKRPSAERGRPFCWPSRLIIPPALWCLWASEFLKRMPYPVTPDGRYFVVRKRLWRCTNPDLPEDLRQRLVAELMQARRQKRAARRTENPIAIETARRAVDAAKRRLGERGDVWWTDGAPDWNQHMVTNTPYAAWFLEIAPAMRG
jgi:hypothetical protein